ncbi:hypothetical protein [Streptomyces sp. NPDC059564]|uniref:hypothetical protein n=1 Tax=Streptomyces sp. NPDC059564 TaxID=3346865 RepID=UPI003692862F
MARPRWVTRARRLAGLRVVALALSVALLTALPGPTVARAEEPPVSACQLADPATAFDTEAATDDTTTVNIGCVQDAATTRCKTFWLDNSCGLRRGRRRLCCAVSPLYCRMYRLTLTTGALILTKSGQKVWSHTARGGTQLRLQTDGNIVVHDKDGHPNWAAGTNNKNPGWLALGTDGSLRLYNAAGQQIWAA